LHAGNISCAKPGKDLPQLDSGYGGTSGRLMNMVHPLLSANLEGMDSHGHDTGLPQLLWRHGEGPLDPKAQPEVTRGSAR